MMNANNPQNTVKSEVARPSLGKAEKTCETCFFCQEEKGFLSESTWLKCYECEAAIPLVVNPRHSCPSHKPKAPF